MNCINHTWQPALGLCMRCGDSVCRRCVPPESRLDRQLLCVPCDARALPSAEPLPFDGEGPWLSILRETSLQVLRHPRRSFSRMADAPFDPAWRFAWGWSLLLVPLMTWRNSAVIGWLLGIIGAAVWVTVSTAVVATGHHLSVLALRGRAKWSLSARTAGYAAPWGTLLTALSLALGAGLAVPFPFPLLAASLMTDTFKVWALYLVGRHRQQLSPLRALVAAAVGTLGLVALTGALIAIRLWTHLGSD